MSEPDLFVVCKNCSSEVSPYVTECPYCGQRVRKRAPKIEKGPPPEPKPRRSRTPSLPRLRRDEIPGIAPETRPYATGALIVLSLLTTLVLSTGRLAAVEMGAVVGPLGGDWWRLLATPFIHDDNMGYLFVSMVAVGVFGMHLERRFGPVAPVAIFLAAGAGGAALAVATDLMPALGANGAALGLLTAWFVEDRRAAARGDDRENDLLGTYVFAAVLLLLAVAEPAASIAAAVGGAAVGAVAGLLLSVVQR